MGVLNCALSRKTRGKKEKNGVKIDVGSDWICYTFKSCSRLDTVLPYGFELGEIIKPFAYYNSAFELSPFGRIDINTRDVKQGSMVTFSGSDCRLADEHLTLGPSEIVSNIDGKDRCRFTRIDLAIDVFESKASPDSLLKAWRKREVKTRVKEFNQIHGWDEETERVGNTLKIGRRENPVFVRAYSKNLESIAKSGLHKSYEGEAELIEELRRLSWCRVETELKGDKARLAGKAITNAGVPQTAKNALERYVNFPTVKWWKQMLEYLPSAETNLMRGENHNKPKSEKWLMTQALPAVLKAIEAGKFPVIDAVETALNKYDRNEKNYIDL